MTAPKLRRPAALFLLAAVWLSPPAPVRAQQTPPVAASRAQAAALSPPAGATTLKTQGFARKDDGGGGLYRRLPAAPEPAEARAWRLRTADGAWWELDGQEMTPQQFGAVGDDDARAALRNVAAFRDAMEFSAGRRRVLRIPAGQYRIAGGIYTFSGLHMRFDDGAWLKPTEYSVYGPKPAGAGAFLSNVTSRADHADSVQSEILIENPQIDGALLPKPFSARITQVEPGGLVHLAPIDTPLIAAGQMRERLKAGRAISVLEGAAAPQTRIIGAVAADGQAFSPALAFGQPLAAGDLVRAASNDNAIGIGVGARNVTIRGGHIRNFIATWAGGGSGGKAVNFEKGCTNCTVDGLRAENVSWGVFVQGTPGTWPAPPAGNGQSLGVKNILFKNIHVRDCEAAAGFYGITREGDPTGDPNVMSVVVDGLEAVNCGVAHSRPLRTFKEKSGALVFAEAQNVVIRRFSLKNDPGYPQNAGHGRKGPIGAVVWGWGYNISVSGAARTDGDQIVYLGRARAMGDDAPPRGQIRQVRKLDIAIAAEGAFQTLIATEPGNIRGAITEASGAELRFAPAGTQVNGALVGRLIRVIAGGKDQVRTILAHDAGRGRITLDQPLSPPAAPGAAFTVLGVERLPPDQAGGMVRLSATRLTGPAADMTMRGYPAIQLDPGTGEARPVSAYVK